MVTPTNATANFVTEKGVPFSANVYIADAVATRCKFSLRAKAGTGDKDYIRMPENSYFVGISILTGPTVIFALVPTRNGAEVQGKVIAVADNLNTLATRVQFRIPVKSGDEFGLTEA